MGQGSARVRGVRALGLRGWPWTRMKGEGRQNGRVRAHGGVCLCVGEYMRGDILFCVCAHVWGCQRHCDQKLEVGLAQVNSRSGRRPRPRI